MSDIDTYVDLANLGNYWEGGRIVNLSTGYGRRIKSYTKSTATITLGTFGLVSGCKYLWFRLKRWFEGVR